MKLQSKLTCSLKIIKIEYHKMKLHINIKFCIGITAAMALGISDNEIP